MNCLKSADEQTNEAAAMKERGILFGAPMVLALLAGRKTQTRRPVSRAHAGEKDWVANGSPYGAAGDRLWVRETWRLPRRLDSENMRTLAQRGAALGLNLARLPVQYEADGARRNWPDAEPAGRYRNARFMPRVASRILLTVTEVRVERFSDMSEEDALAEGMELIDADRGSACAAYRRTWSGLHGEDSWKSDPLVWVVEFAPLPAGAKENEA
jgi:hypothetical protein